MGVLAGQRIIAGKVPGQRIGTTTVATSDSSTFTAETVIDTWTGPLVTGRTYRVRWVCSMQSDVNDDGINSRLREDNLAGTQMVVRREQSYTNQAGSGPDMSLEAQFTAISTGDKTFVGTGARSTGTGNITAEGSSITPRLLYVEYVEG